MVGHTVRVLVDYDGLRGCFGTVLEGDFGDGKVLVAVTGAVTDQRREICFLIREVETVPMNDTLTHTGQLAAPDHEVYLLIRRNVDQRRLACSGELSDRLAAALQRRSDRLRAEVRSLQRARAVRDAHKWLRAFGSPCCTALVVVQGGGDVGDRGYTQTGKEAA